MSRSRSSSAKHEIDDSSSNTSENESSSAGVPSENDVSYDDHHAVERAHKNDAVHHQQHYHHHHRHHHHQDGGHCSYFKPKSFMSAHVQPTAVNSGPVSVRYSVQGGTFDNQPNRSRMPARHDPFIQAGSAGAYFPQASRDGMIPQGQPCMTPQYVYDNFGYKPTNFQYQLPPAAYQFYPPHPIMMNQVPQQMRSRRSSSENLESVGMMNGGGSEYISIKYMAPPGRLVKGEAANTFRSNQQQQTTSFTSPIQMMPNGGMGFVGPQGSQHALNFNQGFPQNGSYRAYNFDLFQQQPQASMMVATQTIPSPAAHEQQEIEEENVSRSGSKRDKKDKNTINKKSGNKSGEDISAGSSGVAEVNGTTTTTTAVSSVTNRVVNKPAVSSQWVLTGGAPPDQGSAGTSQTAESRNAGVNNYFRSTNGYYDDSINDRAMLGAVDKEESQFKKYCKICGITAVVSFVLISIVLGAVFGFILKNDASTEKPKEVARLFPIASNLTEVVDLIAKDLKNSTNITLSIMSNSSSSSTTSLPVITTRLVTEKAPEVLNVTSIPIVSIEHKATTSPEAVSSTKSTQDVVSSTEKPNNTALNDLQDSIHHNMTGKAKKFFLLNMINQFVKNSSDTIIKPTQEAVNSSISAIESTITSLHSALSNIISNKMENLVPNMNITGLEKFNLNTTSRNVILVSEETSTIQPEILTTSISQETSTTTLASTTISLPSSTVSTTTIETTETSSTTLIVELKSSTSTLTTTTSKLEQTSESTTELITLETTQKSTELPTTTQIFEFDLETPAEEASSTLPSDQSTTPLATTIQSSL